MQCVFLEKRYTQKLGIFEHFCVKCRPNLTVGRVIFNCKLQEKIGGAGCRPTSCCPWLLALLLLVPAPTMMVVMIQRGLKDI